MTRRRESFFGRSGGTVPVAMSTFARTILIFALLIGGGFAAFLLVDGPAGGSCETVAGVSGDVAGDATAVSIAHSAAVWPCADVAVIADADDPVALAFGARLATLEGVPLLASRPGAAVFIREELDRLGADDVLVVAGPAVSDPLGGAVAEAWDPDDPAAIAALEARIADALEPGRPAVGVPEDSAAAFAAARTAIVEDRPLVVGTGPASASAPLTAAGEPLWVTTTDRADVGIAALAAAHETGAVVALADGADPRRSHALRPAADEAESVSVLGDLNPDQRWQLRTLLTAPELPGGGVLVFEPGRRYVALYGNPNTDDLGVLGEQGPQGWEETHRRLEQATVDYDADGLAVVPTFEIIATVAAGSAGPDGDYSAEMTIDLLSGWVDYAEANGIYVVLDLQPGRTDFLTQAKRYEPLLRRPHVGLALDPEWRLEPDQVHLEQVGSVDIEEVNATADWLAGVVRQNNLPQKLFLVHQFRFSMIEGRDRMRVPSELAAVIQMDGQGPLATKYITWQDLTAGTEAAPWRWGWKNFYDEDDPTATPAEVLALDPTVWFVSYQ